MVIVFVLGMKGYRFESYHFEEVRCRGGVRVDNAAEALTREVQNEQKA